MPASTLIPVRFLENYFGIPQLYSPTGRMLIIHSGYVCGEVAGFPAETAAALQKAGIAELVEPDEDALKHFGLGGDASQAD